MVNISKTIREARLRWLGQSKGRCGKHKGDNGWVRARAGVVNISKTIREARLRW